MRKFDLVLGITALLAAGLVIGYAYCWLTVDFTMSQKQVDALHQCRNDQGLPQGEVGTGASINAN